MTKKQQQLENLIKATMAGSNLMPDFENDFYENYSGTTQSNFLEGICLYFDYPRDHYIFHFNSLEYMNSPSETIEFLVDQIGTHDV